MFFQAFSCVQWGLQLYWHYALVVLLITVAAACVSLAISRANLRRLRDISRHDAAVVVRRGGADTTVGATHIAPGDVFVVEDGADLPCDALLVAGECLVNEAMLTGESVPSAKSPAPPAAAGVPHPARAQLSGGTRVMQIRPPACGGPVLAVACRTGYESEKGRLVRAILFPRAGRLDLGRDAARFVAWVLLPMALAGGVASCAHALARGDAFTLASALDLVSIAVPPALPAAMLVCVFMPKTGQKLSLQTSPFTGRIPCRGVATAVDRLRRAAVFCISPARVNMAGKVTLVCFDKTGTLTAEGLELLSVLPVNPPDAASSPPAPASFGEELPAARVAHVAPTHACDTPAERLVLTMAACHSLRSLRAADGGSGKLVGDPLECVPPFFSPPFFLSG